MAHTFAELKKKTVAELREIAAGVEHEAVKGYTQLNKEQVLKALCTALNIDMFEHHTASGEKKLALKAKIRELKKRRDEVLRGSDKSGLPAIRRRIHLLKRGLRALAA